MLSLRNSAEQRIIERLKRCTILNYGSTRKLARGKIHEHTHKREKKRGGGDFMEELHGQINHTILWTFDELLVVFLGYVLIVGDAKHETRVF